MPHPSAVCAMCAIVSRVKIACWPSMKMKSWPLDFAMRAMSRDVPVSAAMMTQIARLAPDAHIAEAVDTLLRTSQSEFPVGDSAGRLVGLLGRDDMIRALDLAAVRGVATINGKAVGEGKGAQAMGHPLDAVAWMADHLARHGRGLLRGDVVITGSLITSKNAKQGELVKFALEGLGEAELRID